MPWHSVNALLIDVIHVHVQGVQDVATSIWGCDVCAKHSGDQNVQLLSWSHQLIQPDSVLRHDWNMGKVPSPMLRSMSVKSFNCPASSTT